MKPMKAILPLIAAALLTTGFHTSALAWARANSGFCGSATQLARAVSRSPAARVVLTKVEKRPPGTCLTAMRRSLSPRPVQIE